VDGKGKADIRLEQCSWAGCNGTSALNGTETNSSACGTDRYLILQTSCTTFLGNVLVESVMYGAGKAHLLM
jgi:hypothetical protein